MEDDNLPVHSGTLAELKKLIQEQSDDMASDRSNSRGAVSNRKELPRTACFRGRFWNDGFGRRHRRGPPAVRGSARSESQGLYAPDDAEKIEGFRSSGYVKINGKHIAADGQVSRDNRYRRVFRDSATTTTWEREELGAHAEQLKDLAKIELQGRNLAVYERFLDPLISGVSPPPISQVAEEFGLPVRRIYKIKNDCRKKLLAAALKCGLAADPADPADTKDYVAGSQTLIRTAEQTRALCARWKDRNTKDDVFKDAVTFHTILNRSAAVDGLLSEAKAARHQSPREYVCRTIMLHQLVDKFRKARAKANDPILSGQEALEIVGWRLWSALPDCRVTCDCGGGGPHAPDDPAWPCW